jgi:methyl-accepting chemotaxis protein
MRMRIASTVIISVVVALTLVGAGTFGLVRAESRRSAQTALENQAEALAEMLAVAFAGPREQPYIPKEALNRVSEAPGEWEVGVVAINGRGESFGELPDGIELSAAQQTALEAGGAVSGRVDGRLFAADGQPSGRGVVIVGLMSDAVPRAAEGAGWFLLASAVVIGLAVAAALCVGKVLARPIRDATAAAERIADGELGARLPDPSPRDSDERAALARSLNSMAEALERSRVLEQRFLLSISHDLRNRAWFKITAAVYNMIRITALDTQHATA